MAQSPLIQPDIKNQYIARLLMEGSRTDPVQHWTQGMARALQGMVGGLERGREEYQSREAPNELLKIYQASQGQPQHPLGPVTSGPRPANASPAFAPPPAPPGSTNERVATAFAPFNPPAAQPSPTDPRGIRNNNALNIEAGPFTQRQPGFAGSDGRFARFENPQQGLDAASNLLASYGQRGINTVAGVINRWAPSSDGNPVNAYASHVARKLGVGPNDPIDLSDPQVRQGLVMAMGEFENGRPIQVAQAGGAPVAMPQGGAPAPQGGQPQAMGQQPGQPNVAMIQQMINHPNARVRAYGTQLLQQLQAQQMKPPDFGVIGKDSYGNEQRGWIDPRNRTLTPASPSAPNFVDTKKLRDEVRDLPSYKNLAQSAPVYKSMVSAAGRDNRAADVNLIYGMAKIMDPGSVVRESEMTVAQAVATLPQHLQSTIMSQLNATGRLAPEVRAAIMQEAHSRITSYQSMFDTDMNMYRGIAQEGRFNPAHVIPQFGQFEPFKAPNAAPPAAAGQSGQPTPSGPAPTGAPPRAKNAQGQVIEWNGQQWVPVQ